MYDAFPFLCIVRFLLWPFAMIYGAVMAIRNLLYDYQILKSTQFDIPVISVGNLSMGGTGKTPSIQLLIRLLESDYKIAVLSRGYGRKNYDFQWVHVDSDPLITGDEPLLIKMNHPEVSVAVNSNRVEGIIKIMTDFPETNLILLDDAFQHRAVKPFLNILLSTQKKPFYKDFVVPMGTLREFRKGFRRSDAVIITKTDSQLDIKQVEQSIPGKEVFYSEIVADYPEMDKVFGFSAIADNASFQSMLRTHYELVGFKSFMDHHRFQEAELNKLLEEASSVPLICTEKDWVKLGSNRDQVSFVKIKHQLKEEEKFKDWLFSKLREFES